VASAGHTGAVPEPLRVCHVIHSLGPGGAEAVLVDLAQAASQARLQLSVVSLTPTDGEPYNAARLRAAGVSVTAVPASTRWSPVGLQRGVRSIRRTQPDVIHSHLKHADLVGAAASQRLGVPLVSTLHLIEDAVTPLGRGKRWLAAQARVRRAAATIAVSAALRDWYTECFRVDPSRVHVIPNGVTRPTIEPSARTRLRDSFGIAPDETVAVMVGIMRPGKGHEELLDALTHVDVGVRFLFVGDGPLRAELEARAASLRPGRVIFTGFRTDVADLLGAADIVVHPSLFDALPTALISALAVGRPIIATHVGGIPEIVTPDVGVLVEPGDPAALGEAVTTMARNPRTRAQLSAAARRRYETQFEADLWARRLRAVYDEVRP